MGRNNLDKPSIRPLKADKRYERRCGRTRYATPVDATIALGRIDKGLVARKCPVCGGYHLVHPGERLEGRRAGRMTRA